MSNTNKKERMLNDVNEHLDSFGRWNNGFEDEFETVMYLMTQKIQFLSMRAKDPDKGGMYSSSIPQNALFMRPVDTCGSIQP